MTDLLARARAAAPWLLTALVVPFGLRTLGEGWIVLEPGAPWRVLIVPVLAALGTISLVRQSAGAGLRPARQRAERRPRR